MGIALLSVGILVILLILFFLWAVHVRRHASEETLQMAALGMLTLAVLALTVLAIVNYFV